MILKTREVGKDLTSTSETSSKWFVLSIACVIIGIIAWLPNFIFDFGYPYPMLTFIINPIGVVFAVVGKSTLGIILNVIMTFSFFLLMFFGYLFYAF